MSQALYTIKVVSRRTGLTTHVIRVWEKRYKTVRPMRSETRRRLYSDEEVERLLLLHEATAAGHSIGTIAALPDQALRDLVAADKPSLPWESRKSVLPSTHATILLEKALAATSRLNARALESALDKAAVTFGTHGMLEKLIAPLAEQIGELWRNGEITAAHEHFATALIRVFLGKISQPFAGTDTAPVLVVTTPTGQLHELGAVMAAAAAADVGWKVVYLGPSLPMAEIAGAAVQHRARAVALSVVYPDDDPRLPQELEALRRYLPPEMALLVGGRAAPAYSEALVAISAIHLKNMSELCTALDRLRRGHPGAERGTVNGSS